MLNIFLLIGLGVKKEFAKFAVDPQTLSSQERQGLDGFFECLNEEDYTAAMSGINSIVEANPEKKLHLIIYGHGQKDGQIQLGKKIFPEAIFEDLISRNQQSVISVVSCHSGSGIKRKQEDGDAEESEKISPKIYDERLKLNQLQTMIFYAGKRVTISTTDTFRVLELIKSQDFVPQLLLPQEDGSIELMPSETVKIATEKGVEKFSPFELFKNGGTPNRQEILAEILRQQIAIEKFLKPEEVSKFEALTPDDLEKKVSPQSVENYLRDLAFMVAITKEGKKVEYLQHLVDGLQVDLTQPREFCGEQHSLILEACAAGNSEVVKFLLEKNPTEISQTNASGNNVFHCAAIGGSREVFEILFAESQKNASTKGLANVSNKAEQTPADIAVSDDNWAISNFALEKNLCFDLSELSVKELLPPLGEYKKLDEFFKRTLSYQIEAARATAATPTEVSRIL